MTEPLTMGCKWCPRCHRNQPVTQFPVDRSRRDGLWHSCKSCSKKYWQERGEPLRTARRDQARRQRARSPGLAGLRFYSHQKSEEMFGSVPPSLKGRALTILSRSLESARREGRPLTPARLASFYAAAASNAPRLGDRSFAARMNACKRWKRHREDKRQTLASEEPGIGYTLSVQIPY
jgi:hypothetical protein